MATAQALRRTLISRMIYPALLLATAVIVVWALGVFVVPRFAETLEALGGELPWQTAFTLAAADALVWAVPALALTAAGLFALRSRILGPAARRTIARRSLSVPIVGSLIWHRHAAMICDTVATMIEGGGDVLAGVDQAIDVCTQPELKRRLTSARESVREGVSLDEALRAQQVLPKMLTAVVSVGLRSGELGTALRRAAELAMEKQDTMSQRLLTLLEPAVIAIMAGAVFWVVYSLIKGMLAMSEGAL
jgi:general secretion pathway protein F